MFIINALNTKSFRQSFNISNLIQKRYKKTNPKTQPINIALEYFDDFYKRIYGSKWPSIRLGLLSPHKYFAVINNFGDTETTINKMESIGALNLKTLFDIEKQNIKEKRLDHIVRDRDKIFKLDTNKESHSSFFPNHDDNNVKIEEVGLSEHVPKNINEINYQDSETVLDDFTVVENSKSIEIPFDEHRCIDPHVGLSASALYEFIPTTRLRGLEEWVPESKALCQSDYGNIETKIQQEWDLNFPKHLKVYTYEQGNLSSFPSPKNSSTGVLSHFLLDGSSILPVLALGIQPGDTVLDMCAAPGGKSHAILQTLYPSCLVANDVSISRANRVNTIMDEYFYQMKQNNLFNIVVTTNDGRSISDENFYNKILVDVPCTTDRHSLMFNDNNIFKSNRIKERLQIPELQLQLLSNALNIIKVGGTVVYSTCTLSPMQNDGVVHLALKAIWEETNYELIIKDLSRALEPARGVFKFGEDIGLRYGHLVLPYVPSNFGPMYFCKIVRTR